jgi:hypothetical protein
MKLNGHLMDGLILKEELLQLGNNQALKYEILNKEIILLSRVKICNKINKG